MKQRERRQKREEENRRAASKRGTGVILIRGDRSKFFVVVPESTSDPKLSATTP
jgi:hypothetical protein